MPNDADASDYEIIAPSSDLVSGIEALPVSHKSASSGYVCVK